MIVPVERGSARDPAGLIAVRKLDDGYLACRELASGEPLAAGEWRAREHVTGRCTRDGTGGPRLAALFAGAGAAA